MFIGLAEGLPFKVDPIPLTLEGELVARIQGRSTFGWNAGIRQCYYRDEYRMRKVPRPAVFAQHKCNAVLFQFIEVRWAGSIARTMKYMQPLPDQEQFKHALEGALFPLSEALNAKVIEEIPF